MCSISEFTAPLSFIRLTSHHRSTNRQTPWNSHALSDLKGRLYPCPYDPHFYFLDFIDDNGMRRDITNLNIYPYSYPPSESNHEVLQPASARSDRRGGVDIHILTPRLSYEICDADQRKLKSFSFICRTG